MRQRMRGFRGARLLDSAVGGLIAVTAGGGLLMGEVCSGDGASGHAGACRVRKAAGWQEAGGEGRS